MCAGRTEVYGLQAHFPDDAFERGSRLGKRRWGTPHQEPRESLRPNSLIGVEDLLVHQVGSRVEVDSDIFGFGRQRARYPRPVNRLVSLLSVKPPEVI